MTNYPLFVFLAVVTVASPGPGILLSVGNAIRNGIPIALSGIFGLAAGAMIVGFLSVSGLGVLIAASPSAYNVLNFMGAAYLLYLGAMQWRDVAPKTVTGDPNAGKQKLKTFLQAITMQFTNPKSIMFFVSILPQFVVSKTPAISDFSTLVLTYALLVVIVHTLYALIARHIGKTGVSGRWRIFIRRLGSVAFIAFAASLAMTSA